MKSIERLRHRIKNLEHERKGKMHLILRHAETESVEDAITRYSQENKVRPKDNLMIVSILEEDLLDAQTIDTEGNKLDFV